MSDETRLPTIAAERLPWHPAMEERYGIDRAGWRALTDAVFPAARSVEGILLAMSYCRARKLDVFKRPVHVVPIWDSSKNQYTESVWPGIGELRTTAFRTGLYGGCDAATFGPDETVTFSGQVGKRGQERHIEVEVTYPEWCQVTVYRMVGAQRCPIPGPRVYWRETYARQGRTDVPNEMWSRRPRGQLEKCAEAAALRRAFPEEVGEQYTNDEIGDQMRDITPAVVPTEAPPATFANQVRPPATPGRAAQQTPAPRREEAGAAAASPSAGPEPADEGYTWVDDDGEVQPWQKITDNRLGIIRKAAGDHGADAVRERMSPMLRSDPRVVAVVAGAVRERMSPMLRSDRRVMDVVAGAVADAESVAQAPPAAPPQDEPPWPQEPPDQPPTGPTVSWLGQAPLPLGDEYAVAQALTTTAGTCRSEAALQDLFGTIEPGRDHLPSTLVNAISGVYAAALKRIQAASAPASDFQLGA